MSMENFNNQSNNLNSQSSQENMQVETGYSFEYKEIIIFFLKKISERNYKNIKWNNFKSALETLKLNVNLDFSRENNFLKEGENNNNIVKFNRESYPFFNPENYRLLLESLYSQNGVNNELEADDLLAENDLESQELWKELEWTNDINKYLKRITGFDNYQDYANPRYDFDVNFKDIQEIINGKQKKSFKEIYKKDITKLIQDIDITKLTKDIITIINDEEKHSKDSLVLNLNTREVFFQNRNFNINLPLFKDPNTSQNYILNLRREGEDLVIGFLLENSNKVDFIYTIKKNDIQGIFKGEFQFWFNILNVFITNLKNILLKKDLPNFDSDFQKKYLLSKLEQIIENKPQIRSYYQIYNRNLEQKDNFDEDFKQIILRNLNLMLGFEKIEEIDNKTPEEKAKKPQISDFVIEDYNGNIHLTLIYKNHTSQLKQISLSRISLETLLDVLFI